MLRFERIPTGPLQTNCYLVWDEEEGKGVIIDPGEDAEKILTRVKAHEVTIERIIATHCHFDHVGAVGSLKRDLGCDFLIHKDETEVLQRAETSAARWGLTVEQPPDPDGYVEDGDEIIVGQYKLIVLHTPGHSPGGISLYHDDAVFVGDCLFQGSIGRTDFEGGSFKVLERTIKEKLYTLPDETNAHTGHGPPTTIGAEKRSNPFVRG